MSHLINQRKAIIAALITGAITIHGLVIENFEFLVTSAKDWTKLLKFVLSGGFVYSSIVIFPLYLYDNFLWKWLNSKYNLCGKWEVSVTKLKSLNGAHLTQAGVQEAERFAEQIISSSVECSIQQNPFRQWVEEATGQSIGSSSAVITYTAEIIGVHLPGKITVVFEAVVDGNVSGRDHLTVKERDWMGKPTILVGNAFHVFSNFDIVIRGDIVYRRKIKGKLNNSEPYNVSASQVRPVKMTKGTAR